MQPHLMACKLLKLGVNPRLILRIVDFLVNSSQTFRHPTALSSSCSISTGSPQGTVLLPFFFLFFFTLYTNECTGTDTTPKIKYSDDSATDDLSNSDLVYFAEFEKFDNSCRDNSLDLNVKKTKDMLTDFRKVPVVIPDLFIDGAKVERVTEYKYKSKSKIITVSDNILNFNKNVDFIHKRYQPRMFCLQTLRSFNVNAAVLHTFYYSCTESALTFSFICWLGSLIECEKQECPEQSSECVWQDCGLRTRTFMSVIRMPYGTEGWG